MARAQILLALADDYSEQGRCHKRAKAERRRVKVAFGGTSGYATRTKNWRERQTNEDRAIAQRRSEYVKEARASERAIEEGSDGGSEREGEGELGVERWEIREICARNHQISRALGHAF